MSQLLGLAAVVIGLIGYAPYLWGMYYGRVRPHTFTWFLWGLLTAVAYAVQVSDHAGAGSWVTGVTALICFGVTAWAWRQSRFANVTRVDWYCLAAALTAIPMWWLTRTPLYSVLLIALIDVLAYVPTFRKSWHHPRHEAVLTYLTSSLKFLLGIAALPEQTFISSFYPWSVVITNVAFILMVLYRRHVRKVA